MTSPAPRSVPAVVALVTSVALGVAAWWCGRDLWFFSDDWNIVAQFPGGRLLEPFNSHLSAVPVGVYQLLFHTVGLGSYWPYRLVGFAAYALLGATVWRYAAARAGGWVALAAVTVVLWSSAGVTNVMFPFLLNFSIPVAAAAAIWWHLDRDAPRHDAWASWWLVVALATSGLGLLAAVAVAVELALVRAGWRRWATFAPGPVLWLGWYVAYGVDAPANGGLGEVVPYALRMVLGGFTALGAGSQGVGLVLAAAFAALVVVAAQRRVLDARVAGALAAAGAFALLTAWSRTGVVPAIAPDEVRYRWTVAAFLVLAVVGLLPRVLAAGPALPRPALGVSAAAAIVLVVAGVVVLAGQSRDWAEMVRSARPGLEAVTLATEAGGDALDRDRVIPLSFVPVRVGEYLDAVEELGTPVAGIDVGAIEGRDDQRRAADAVLAEAVAATPPAGRRCDPGGVEVEVVPGSSVEVTASSAGVVAVRRFVRDGDPEPATVAVPAGTTVLTLPADPAGTRGERPYRLTAPDDVELSVCR